MKQLLLIRHGKSSWDFPGTPDRDRPLNQRGRKDAPKMAAALGERGVVPGAIVSSSAARASSTASMIAEGVGFPAGRIVFDESVYLASPRTLLKVIQQLDESVDTALIFGHNPGMHDTVDLLTGDDVVEKFPTLGVARLELDVDHWGEVDEGCGSLVELLTPKNLKKE
ncbi:MAG: histidine phosphatase family protein [Verrucomicrobiales bacterium]